MSTAKPGAKAVESEEGGSTPILKIVLAIVLSLLSVNGDVPLPR